MSEILEQEVTRLRNTVNFLTGLRGQSVREIVVTAEASVLPGLTVSPNQQAQIERLFGTTPLEALYIVDGLRRTREVDGDVCEFGVAQGRTSGLMAVTLMEQQSRRRLWLYDSFEGLPAPTEKDVMLHDLYGLGSMGAYEGVLSVPELEVRTELARVHFPSEQTEVCRGWIEERIKAGHRPGKVSFAFLDMDFYQSTKDVLEMLIEDMPSGGRAVIDDYGFFSQGVQTAVEEIMTEHPEAFALDHPFGFKFAILTKL